MSKTIASASATALPYRPIADQYRGTTDVVDIIGLGYDRLTIDQAATVWSAFRAAREALRGVLNSPACSTPLDGFNAAGDQIEPLLDAINVEMVKIFDHVMTADLAPADERAAYQRQVFVGQAIADITFDTTTPTELFDAIKGVIARFGATATASCR